mmetsp:Transcript_95447/g.274959  ORF Transcript_95447/g.274959 Transcript_95447/m.274959 type:complete len:202 (-) Transcript_95447:619-1224(-)
MPHDGQHPLVRAERTKVRNEVFDHLQRERVLFVQQRCEQDGCRSIPRSEHAQSDDRGSDMHRRDRRLAQHRAQDANLSQGAVLSSHRQHDALEKRRGFEQGLFQRSVVVEVQSLVLSNVLPYSRQKHQIEEALRHARIQIRSENGNRLVHRGGAPVQRVREGKHLLPIRQARDHLESFRQLTRLVCFQPSADLAVHLYDFR